MKCHTASAKSKDARVPVPRHSFKPEDLADEVPVPRSTAKSEA